MLNALPSRSLPQRNMLASASVIADCRVFLDVDIVWDCEMGSWLILERCANPKRWARINGELIKGWRAASYYMDEDGTPFALDNNIVPWLRSLDFKAYDSRMDKFEAAKYAVADRQREKIEAETWARADHAFADKALTASGQRGVAKIKNVGDSRPLFGKPEKKVYASSGWGA